MSLRFGSLSITTGDAIDAIVDHDPAVYEQTIVRQLRVPRTLIAISVGAALAVAGAVMQAVTRNPLADPSILGVSQGASLAVAMSITWLGMTNPNQYVWMSFGGALIASVIVFAVASAGHGGASPVKLALAGVVVSAMMGAWNSALLLMNQDTLDRVRMWLAGSVAGRELETLWAVMPFLAVGTGTCLLLGHQLNVLSMGDESARALGMNTALVRAIASILVIFMTGAAVSVAGPIGFVGLATPHVVRPLVGPDNRWVLPYSCLVGAILLTSADVVGRIITKPAELQVGIVTALVGAPFLVLLARRTRLAD
jgi:iron complex transport system permease protein